MRNNRLVRLIVFLACTALTLPASAQERRFGPSFLTPFPQNDVYSVLLVGDELAEGLMYGMLEAFAADNRIQIRQRRYQFNGLMRPQFEKKLAAFENHLISEPVNIAVVMMGVWDRVSLRGPNRKKVPVGAPAWKTEYEKRGEKLIKLLKRRGISVYWVGLPNMARYDRNEDSQMMNDVLRERVYLNGLKYIDAYAGFTSEDGGFSRWGPDITGKIVRLRRRDGITFTRHGNRKLAHFVERDLKRDLTQARQARSIPLLGTEAEQARINPDKEKLAPPAEGRGKNAKANPGGAGKVEKARDPQSKKKTAATDGGQKADPGRISLRTISASGTEDVVTIDIVRPAIPASVVALVTRRESPDRPSRMGATLIDQIAGGLAVMSSVTPPATGGPGGARGPKLSTAQTPYYRVLFRGERLIPKPGRSDDVSWPRPDSKRVSKKAKATRSETGSTDAVVPPLVLPDKRR